MQSTITNIVAHTNNDGEEPMSTNQTITTREATRRRVLLTLKKFSYLIAMLPLALPPLLLSAGQGNSSDAPYFA